MPFTSEKQRRYLWATGKKDKEGNVIARKWADEDPDADSGLPTYAHGKSTSPEIKKKFDKLKKRKKEEEESVDSKGASNLEAKPQRDPAPLRNDKRDGGKDYKRDFEWFHRLMYSYETSKHEKRKLKKQYPAFNEKFKRLKREGS